MKPRIDFIVTQIDSDSISLLVRRFRGLRDILYTSEFPLYPENLSSALGIGSDPAYNTLLVIEKHMSVEEEEFDPLEEGESA